MQIMKILSGNSFYRPGIEEAGLNLHDGSGMDNVLEEGFNQEDNNHNMYRWKLVLHPSVY